MRERLAVGVNPNPDSTLEHLLGTGLVTEPTLLKRQEIYINYFMVMVLNILE